MRLELTVMEGECAEGETARHHHLHLHIRENTYIAPIYPTFCTVIVFLFMKTLLTIFISP